MTGQQLIDLIKANELEDFEFIAKLSEIDSSGWGVNVRSFMFEDRLADIGHSDKMAILDLTER